MITMVIVMVIREKAKNPDKLEYPPEIVPILEELPKWSCEYLSTINKGLEEVQGWDRPLLRRLLQIILDGKIESKKQYQRGQQSPNKRKHIRGRSVAIAASPMRTTISIVEE
ncbi:hypothetical protein F8M41_014347 [Gigaspora margarita]|uniref:Uncharacterized protein n=1 Tax=Gigaspora margarita TaxID=4874 RepID=A0A8H3WWL4_GIGMA|nr:hypothetical protein F8M41_014347 [Gigaspora margarita]